MTCSTVTAVPCTLATPIGCCSGVCDSYYFVATYDCTSKVWTVDPVPLKSANVDCFPNLPWALNPATTCGASTTIYVPHGAPQPSPGTPGSLAPDPSCCPALCDEYSFSASYNCGTSSWTVTGPTLVASNVACSTDTAWALVSACAASRNMWVTHGNPPPSSAAPAFAPPSCCPSLCSQCATPALLPATVTINFGSTVLQNACGGSTWTPGTLTLVKTNTGTVCTYAYGTYQTGHYANVEWNGSHWTVYVENVGNPASPATTTSWYLWTGSSLTCDPTGTFSSPTSTSTCLGGSTAAGTISVTTP